MTSHPPIHAKPIDFTGHYRPEVLDLPFNTHQTVAHNVRMYRKLCAVTQAEAGKLVEPYLGRRISAASWSSMERSVFKGRRYKRIDVEELSAFSKVFGVPIMLFFKQPTYAELEDEYKWKDYERWKLARLAKGGWENQL